MRKIDKIIIHCSATKEGEDWSAKDIDKWHKQKGWKKIGYHFVIRLDGRIEEGRKIEEIGAHCSGHNADSIGICYIGGLDKNGVSKDTRTEAQKLAMFCLIKVLKDMFNIKTENIRGHRDFPNVHKDCPCFSVESWLTETGIKKVMD